MAFFFTVREGGLEPPRRYQHTDLNRARLPIPPLAPTIAARGANRTRLPQGDCPRIPPGDSHVVAACPVPEATTTCESPRAARGNGPVAGFRPSHGLKGRIPATRRPRPASPFGAPLKLRRLGDPAPETPHLPQYEPVAGAKRAGTSGHGRGQPQNGVRARQPFRASRIASRAAPSSVRRAPRHPLGVNQRISGWYTRAAGSIV